MTTLSPASTRQNALNVLRYEPYEKLPVVHFGFWSELLAKWETEGRVPPAKQLTEYPLLDQSDWAAHQLGFDFEWMPRVYSWNGLRPRFEWKVVKELPDGSRHILNTDGVITLQMPDALSIPAEIAHTLVDRESWEKEYLPRLQWNESRVTEMNVATPDGWLPLFGAGGEFLKRDGRGPIGIGTGSIIGWIRNWVGVENLAYLNADDPELIVEMVDTVGGLIHRCLDHALNLGVSGDFIHFWEDICFNHGPLVTPTFFREHCAPWYRKITGLARSHGIEFASVDCDGCIDQLVPIWLENGVNVMFPIEVGTWHASIAPWREKYGREIRGVGGVDKKIFAQDRAAIDREIERLRPLVELGGYIPCPDHRIPLEAEWDLIRYYCDRMQNFAI